MGCTNSHPTSSVHPRPKRKLKSAKSLLLAILKAGKSKSSSTIAPESFSENGTTSPEGHSNASLHDVFCRDTPSSKSGNNVASTSKESTFDSNTKRTLAVDEAGEMEETNEVKEKCDVNKSGASESTGNQGASEPSVIDNGGKKMDSDKDHELNDSKDLEDKKPQLKIRHVTGEEEEVVSKLKRPAINDEGKLDSDASSEEFTVKPQKVEEGPSTLSRKTNVSKKIIAVEASASAQKDCVQSDEMKGCEDDCVSTGIEEMVRILKELPDSPCRRRAKKSKAGISTQFESKATLHEGFSALKKRCYKKLIFRFWTERCELIESITTLKKSIKEQEIDLELYVSLNALDSRPGVNRDNTKLSHSIKVRQKKFSQDVNMLYEMKRALATTEARLDIMITRCNPELRYVDVYNKDRKSLYLSPIPEETEQDLREYERGTFPSEINNSMTACIVRRGQQFQDTGTSTDF